MTDTPDGRISGTLTDTLTITNVDRRGHRELLRGRDR